MIQQTLKTESLDPSYILAKSISEKKMFDSERGMKSLHSGEFSFISDMYSFRY